MIADAVPDTADAGQRCIWQIHLSFRGRVPGQGIAHSMLDDVLEHLRALFEPHSGRCGAVLRDDPDPKLAPDEPDRQRIKIWISRVWLPPSHVSAMINRFLENILPRWAEARGLDVTVDLLRLTTMEEILQDADRKTQDGGWVKIPPVSPTGDPIAWWIEFRIAVRRLDQELTPKVGWAFYDAIAACALTDNVVVGGTDMGEIRVAPGGRRYLHAIVFLADSRDPPMRLSEQRALRVFHECIIPWAESHDMWSELVRYRAEPDTLEEYDAIPESEKQVLPDLPLPPL